MCGSMVHIQSAAAEIRRRKKDRQIQRRNHRAKIWCPHLLCRAAIIIICVKKLQFIYTVKGDGSNTAKMIKGTINHTNIAWVSMLVWLIVPFYDFCVFNPSPLTVCINCSFFMTALCNRAGHIYFHPVVSYFFFFSSPNLSGRRLDVYHTSTHGVALVQI